MCSRTLVALVGVGGRRVAASETRAGGSPGTGAGLGASPGACAGGGGMGHNRGVRTSSRDHRCSRGEGGGGGVHDAQPPASFALCVRVRAA